MAFRNENVAKANDSRSLSDSLLGKNSLYQSRAGRSNKNALK